MQAAAYEELQTFTESQAIPARNPFGKGAIDCTHQLSADVALLSDAKPGLEDLRKALGGDRAKAMAARPDYVAKAPQRMAK